MYNEYPQNNQNWNNWTDEPVQAQHPQNPPHSQEPSASQVPPVYQTPPVPPTPPEKKKRGWTGGKIVALALCCALIGSLFGAGGAVAVSYWLTSEPEQTTQEQEHMNLLVADRETAIIDVSKVQTGTLLTPAQVYELNVNSTVGITTSITTNYWGYQTTSAASGSGFILSDDGYILTNFHVIEDSNSITVSMFDGSSYDAELIGYDEANDIAVLKIDAKDLKPVILGSSDGMHVGDSVVAIGNPLGELTFSLTSGTVSALDRTITMSTGSSMTLIQTDCAINSGNSGGALFNLYGEVVGITNAKYSGNSNSGASIDNIAFAIPIDDVRNIIDSIIENGYVVKPFIGVSVTDVSEETQSYGLPEGAAVREVTEAGPAEEAGLQVNDIITKANDTDITGSSDLVKLVSDMAPGDKLELEVYRQGETIRITVTVGEKIQGALEEEQQSQPQGGQFYYPWGRMG